MIQNTYSIHQFPPNGDIESHAVLKKLTQAHRALAELKGICQSIPNQIVLINSLSLQEAKDSSEIENIITTHDELFHSKVLNISRPTAAKYLDELAQAGFLHKQKKGRSNYYINIALFDI